MGPLESGASTRTYVTLPSEAALKEFLILNSCPPKEAEKFNLMLLGIFFSLEELAASNCNKVDGRELLNPDLILGMKCKFFNIL